jgi:uncharacterized protein (UPF0335 family)
MALDEETKKVITEEAVKVATQQLSDLKHQIELAKEEMSNIHRQKEDFRKEVTTLGNQLKSMMEQIDKAADEYAKKTLRFSLLCV